jgi:hypothetical protein
MKLYQIVRRNTNHTTYLISMRPPSVVKAAMLQQMHSSVKPADTNRGDACNDERSQSEVYATLAKKETKIANVLRLVFTFLLVATALLSSALIFVFATRDETDRFEADYQANALKIIDSFHDAVELRLGSINSLANSITSHALATNQTFPFVTIPDFEIRGSDLRVQAGTMVLYWTPLVTDETRAAWEVYAFKNRAQINVAFDEESRRLKRQDDFFDLVARNISVTAPLAQPQIPGTILDDGTGYHPSIWFSGRLGDATEGDAPEGSGPFLPYWQRR